MPYRMEIQTVQSGAIKILTEALKELLTDTVLEVDSTGIRVIAVDISHTCLVHLKLNAEKFETFHCPQRLDLGINILNLYRIIKTISASDTLTLYIEDTDFNHLGIRVDTNDKNTCTNYKLNLLDLESTNIVVQPSHFSSVITLMSSDFQKLIRDMHAIGERVEIKRIRNELIFTCTGDFCTQETVLSENYVHESAGGQEDSNEITQGVFLLQFLVMFTRCSALSPTVDLHLKNDYPLLCVYQVANLGTLKLAAAPDASQT